MNTNNLINFTIVVFLVILCWVIAAQRDQLAQMRVEVDQTNQILREVLREKSIRIHVMERWGD